MSLLSPLDRCRVMGVLNVTPDSFSDGGLHINPEAAVSAGLEMVTLGADLIDVGGESTRPGAKTVSVEIELARVVPVVRALSARGVVVSVDTTKAEVATACLDAGAAVVNDVSCARDVELLKVVASHGVPYILMHNRAVSAEMSQHADYGDCLAEVCGELRAGLVRVVDAGIDLDLVVIDPGLGFAKRAEHNWELLAGIPRLLELGHPVLIGASRKSFLGSVLADRGGAPRPVGAREDATQAITALVASEGVWAVRVHEVGPAVDAVRVVAAVNAARAAKERSNP